MRRKRTIIEIDEEKCNGCGKCILACAEGALALVDGKAKLVGEIYCDGIGACIGECPEGALKIAEHEAEEFDEEAVRRLKEESLQGGTARHGAGLRPDHKASPAGCPGAMARILEQEGPPAPDPAAPPARSQLRQWPVKLGLLGPGAPFLAGSDLVLLADCVAAALPDLHRRILAGHSVAMGCPKLDDLEAHIEGLAPILRSARPASLTAVHMEVPCCGGFVYAAEEAARRAGVQVPRKRVQVGIAGEIQHEEILSDPEGRFQPAPDAAADALGGT